MSKSSRTSLRSFGRTGTRKKKEEHKTLLKPYNFCCDINETDNETRYDERKPPFSSSLMALSPIQESPMLKFRVQSIAPDINAKRKTLKSKSKSKDWNLDGNPCVQTRGPLLWFQEDEIDVAKHQFWSQRQKTYNSEADKNALIGEKKVKKQMASNISTVGPRWYQDLSIPQMKQVLALGETMTADYEETITVRTQKALAVIGVTSTFFKIAPRVIRQLHRSTRLQPVQFLRQIYKLMTGWDFEEEEYKKTYGCNERITLSAIAFLALPDALIELNNRLPQISKPVFPPKPKPPRIPPNRHGPYKSPYEEPLFQPPDYVAYKNSLDKWREKCKLVPRPRVVLPQLKIQDKINGGHDLAETGAEVVDNRNVTQYNSKKEEQPETKMNQNEDHPEDAKAPFDLSIPTLPGGDKQTFEFSISGLGEKSGPVDYKICGTLKPPFPKRKSWLGEKEAHYIISGISEHEDPPQCPVTFVMTGISYVTPDNSDDNFFAELRLGDSPKRFYPAGRKNLSKNWQEWLQDADEEFLEVEREANKLIKSVEATMRLVIPGNRCDACCSCRQTRKTNLASHAAKTPYMVIDSIAEGDNQNRYIVGSLALHSPAPSPAESTVNLLEVVASRDEVEQKLVINGVTNDSGETTFYISGVTEEAQHVPKATVISKEHPPKPLRNVPPCVCTIERMFNEGRKGLGESLSTGDDIPHTKNKGVCYGRKYRPKESPPFTCREYPDDKSCRRNPLWNKLKRGIMIEKNNSGTNDEDDGVPKEKKMFTLPDFNPCGDQDGMAVCGGPWGSRNIPKPEIVAAREAEAKQILRSPPCGSTPGRAVCGGPWGAKNPSVKVSKADEEDDEEEEEEEAEEKLSPRDLAKKAKEAEAEARKLRRGQLKRDKLCSEVNEDGVTDAGQSSARKEPPADCGFDNPWDSMRTAPTVNPWGNEYEKSLRLTQAVQSSDGCKGAEKRAENCLKRKRKEDGSADRNGNKDAAKVGKGSQRNSKTAKDDVQIIYDGISSQQSDAKPPKKSLLTSERSKNSATESPTGRRRSRPKDGEVKSRDKKLRRKPTKVNGRRNKPAASIGNECPNNRSEKSLKRDKQMKKLQIRKQSDARNKKIKPKARSSSSSDPQRTNDTILKEYKIAPAVIPDKPRPSCQREDTGSDKESDNCGCSDEGESSSEARGDKQTLKFGWRTKSQQELPREKTLVYLAEPNDPVEMIKVREGGRACNCRVNRNNKKILVYNIGGAVEVAKNGRAGNRPQVIEGVTYLTPPQSPRNSSEYIPEYELFESPYKMCERKRSDKGLKDMSELSTIRSLSPAKNTNVDSCPCGENISEDSSPKKASFSKESKLSSALKDEGLIDYFVSCQDTVPCWLRCAKFSKAGCCEKPKMLQVKKPVCECRYERRVVRREEEKKKWVNRQQRLKACEKQPHLQVAGTYRPMTQDTKLMISSVKKVLRDGEFVPETQYCVTGIAENYAMAPPRNITTGIAMQSPVVTPEPSKPDILCMCGHRHWSPTDITTGNTPQSSPVRAKGEYPCRGREQKKETTGKIVPSNGETIRADDSEPFEAYHNCADTRGPCKAGFDESGPSVNAKKRKVAKGAKKVADNANGRLKKLKFDTERVSSGPNDDGKSERFIKASSPSNGSPGNQYVALDDSQQNKTIIEDDADLFGLMKIELGKMASEDFVLAKLPECWLIPQLRSWIDYREGKLYTDSMKKELCDFSKKYWDMIQQTKRPSVPLPSLHMTQAEIAKLTFDRVNEIKEKVSAAQAKYYSELRKLRVSEARMYWPTMEFGKFPSLSFKKAYFTYLAGKEADGHVFRPWKIGDTK